MGSDIYWFVEEFDDEEQSWTLLDGSIPFPAMHRSPLIYDGRNYDLFGRLGWRNKRTDDSLTPRGLPDDANPITRASAEVVGEFGLDHSWVTLDEISALAAKAEDPNLRETIELIRRRAQNGGPVRVIYWFDQ